MTVCIHFAKQLHMTTDALKFNTIPAYVVPGQDDDAAYVLKMTDEHRHPYYYSILTEPVPDKTVMTPSDIADPLFHPILAAALLQVPEISRQRLTVTVPLSEYRNAALIRESLQEISYTVEDLKTGEVIQLKFGQVEIIPTTICMSIDALLRDRTSEDDFFEGDDESVKKFPALESQSRIFFLLRVAMQRTEWVIFREESLEVVDAGDFPQSLNAVLFRIKRFYMDRTKSTLRPYSDEKAFEDGYAMFGGMPIDLVEVIREAKTHLVDRLSQQIQQLLTKHRVTDQLLVGEDVQHILEELQERFPQARSVADPEFAVLRGLYKVNYLAQISVVER
ncbi:hypothetical protein RB620_24710 [Paenibacillus sp. LHD-117]|uniref:hypothetical protein n=1 Tax=Paenibacillus sp. LHD-117 TaxID=3071412 RepID=UPI0027E08A94|nr:hypothetical protein [Paenibacillus sp. LHD-117]MDQ6422639.1 hypothetical protein [Paenibacillus sp. LHD-117]